MQGKEQRDDEALADLARLPRELPGSAKMLNNNSQGSGK